MYHYRGDRPELKKIKRFYGSAIVEDYQKGEPKLDIEHLEKYFYSNIENIQSMAWSIAYSRLNSDHKIELIKKYYSDNIYWTFFRIGIKLKSVKLLEWIKGGM